MPKIPDLSDATSLELTDLFILEQDVGTRQLAFQMLLNRVLDDPALAGLLPPGGTANQIPVKSSNEDFAIQWQDAPQAFTPTTLDIFEDFVTGGMVTNNIGKYGWQLNGGSLSYLRAESNRAGLLRLTSASTLSNISGLFMGSGTNVGICLMSENWDFRASIRQPDSGTNSSSNLRIGVCSSSSATVAPTDAAYIGRTSPELNWQYVTRSAGSETRNNSNIAVGADWVNFRIRRISSGSIGFTIDSNPEVVVVENIPTANDAMIFIGTGPVDTVSNKTLDIDCVRFIVPLAARNFNTIG